MLNKNDNKMADTSKVFKYWYEYLSFNTCRNINFFNTGVNIFLFITGIKKLHKELVNFNTGTNINFLILV